MQLKTSLKYISLCFVIILLAFKTNAQRFAYVYIQGDKQTPFYVKLDDVMQPRYGKNHCIIPQLAPGPIHIEILFQQNAFPAQKFTIQVPEGGFRGFILAKRGENFSLYDIQQQFYLPANNSAEDDHVPVYNTAANYVAAGTTAEIPKPAEVTTPPIKRRNAKHSGSRKPVTAKPKDDGQPKFISNIELNNEKTVQPAVQDQVTASPTDVMDNGADNNISAQNKRGILNSDCPAPMDSKEFDNMLTKLQKHSDNYRLKYLLGRLGECYTTSQVRLLTKELNNDPERYQFLKQVYPRVTDQSNFPLLESLLSTQEWKSYFLLIMP